MMREHKPVLIEKPVCLNARDTAEVFDAAAAAGVFAMEAMWMRTNPLILGIQQCKEFTGVYPTGNNIQITKALLGQGEKKVLILAVRRSDMNDKGEILDPWGTPLQFYFSNNEVMIRSAGPNKIWEDSAIASADDLYRSAPKTK